MFAASASPAAPHTGSSRRTRCPPVQAVVAVDVVPGLLLLRQPRVEQPDVLAGDVLQEPGPLDADAGRGGEPPVGPEDDAEVRVRQDHGLDGGAHRQRKGHHGTQEGLVVTGAVVEPVVPGIAWVHTM
ncbi:hypothetical protein GCM10019017_17900 [Streptomyces showdoensis]